MNGIYASKKQPIIFGDLNTVPLQICPFCLNFFFQFRKLLKSLSCFKSQASSHLLSLSLTPVSWVQPCTCHIILGTFLILVCALRCTGKLPGKGLGWSSVWIGKVEKLFKVSSIHAQLEGELKSLYIVLQDSSLVSFLFMLSPTLFGSLELPFAVLEPKT